MTVIHSFNAAEPHLPNRKFIEEPMLKLLIQLGGSIRFSEQGRFLETELAKTFGLSERERDFADRNYNSKGNRKWRNHLQFVRDQLVKKGHLDNSEWDVWRVTMNGYQRIGHPGQKTKMSSHACAYLGIEK
jgi:Mrr restriction endonuclease-like protein